jgi:nicotinate-nucleotide adenylyltransferase
MRIGILGGTFDPIHNGHLYLAEKVSAELHLDKIIFIPAYLPPHKTDIKVTPARHRYSMLKLAIENNKKFEISGIEIRRKGRSYSVDTLKELRKKYGLSAEMFFITGSDSLKDLDKWKDLKGILLLSRFVLVERPHFEIRTNPKDFIILRIDAKDISSTEIRDRIKKAQPINKLLPSKIREYIKKYNLYLPLKACQLRREEGII